MENKVEIGDLRTMTFSGARNQLILDPSNPPSVYVFGCVGSGMSVAIFNKRHKVLGEVRVETVEESLRAYLEEHIEEIAQIAQSYLGTKWDGSDHIGQWEDLEEYDFDFLADAYDSGEIALYWEACDWLEPVRNEMQKAAISGDIEALARAEVSNALGEGVHLGLDDTLGYLRGLAEEIPSVPENVIWIVPPEYEGQIVEYAYSKDLCEEGYGYRYIFDCSDHSRARHYERVEVGADDTWEPWNEEPEVFGWELVRGSI